MTQQKQEQKQEKVQPDLQLQIQKHVNPLICSPSPRDIPEFEHGQDTIPCDKLWVKYHHPNRAYKIMRSYFLDHKEYTHLILHPDDLMVHRSHYDALKDTIEKHDYPVISGICNYSSQQKNILACVIDEMPPLKRDITKYRFVRAGRRVKSAILPVEWAGFPFMWIRRDIVERIAFEDDSEWNPEKPNMGWGFDITFCHRCKALGIPILVDFHVFMWHEKANTNITGSIIKTGLTKPRVILTTTTAKRSAIRRTDVTNVCHRRYLTKEDWKPYPHYNVTLNRLDMV